MSRHYNEPYVIELYSRQIVMQPNQGHGDSDGESIKIIPKKFLERDLPLERKIHIVAKEAYEKFNKLKRARIHMSNEN